MVPITDTTCATRVLGVAAADVALGLDRLRSDRGGRLVVRTDGGELVLDGDGRPGDRPVVARSAYGPVRRYAGVLRVGPLVRVGVEVEALPWSTEASELTLRPIHGRITGRRDAYFTVALDALRRLGDQVERRARLCGPDRAAA